MPDGSLGLRGGWLNLSTVLLIWPGHSILFHEFRGAANRRLKSRTNPDKIDPTQSLHPKPGMGCKQLKLFSLTVVKNFLR